MSITTMGSMIVSAVIALLAGLWGRAVVKQARLERDQARQAHDAITAAGQRLDAARAANQAPVDPKKRDAFERQP